MQHLLRFRNLIRFWGWLGHALQQRLARDAQHGHHDSHREAGCHRRDGQHGAHPSEVATDLREEVIVVAIGVLGGCDAAQLVFAEAEVMMLGVGTAATARHPLHPVAQAAQVEQIARRVGQHRNGAHAGSAQQQRGHDMGGALELAVLQREEDGVRDLGEAPMSTKARRAWRTSIMAVKPMAASHISRRYMRCPTVSCRAPHAAVAA